MNASALQLLLAVLPGGGTARSDTYSAISLQRIASCAASFGVDAYN
jgi:hypothetical protein